MTVLSPTNFPFQGKKNNSNSNAKKYFDRFTLCIDIFIIEMNSS